MSTTYRSSKPKLRGTRYDDVKRHAEAIFRTYTSRTKRKPYIRAAYFGNSKVFLDHFWQHVFQKNRRDRTRRLQLTAAAFENPNNKQELLHHFHGCTADGVRYIVQVREHKRTDVKQLLSVFPDD